MTNLFNKVTTSATPSTTNKENTTMTNEQKASALLGAMGIVATTLATFVGGGTSMGLMAMGYKSGFAAVGIGVAYVIGFFIFLGAASLVFLQ